MSIFDQDLERRPANYVPLSPVSFLLRAARIYPDRVAVIHGARRFTYGQFLERARRLASALARAGVGKGDTVAIMAPNTPQMLEAHYAVPMLGAVLCSINIRLDTAAVGFILRHSETKVVLTDTEFAAVMRPAVAGLDVLVVDIDDAGGERIGVVEYESFLDRGDAAHPVLLPDDEWQAIALNYTSGTTGNPKGVVAHHRGAYLNACANALTFGLSPQSVYAADVSLQRMDLYLGGDAGRRDPCVFAAGGTGADFCRHRGARRDAYVRGAGGAVDVDSCTGRGAARV
jgi:fatty-acyl-CoA synthase